MTSTQQFATKVLKVMQRAAAPPEGRYGLSVLHCNNPTPYHAEWEKDTDLYDVTSPEFRIVRPTRLSNGELLAQLPFVLRAHSDMRSRTTMRVDEVANPLQRAFCEHFQLCQYEVAAARPLDDDTISRNSVVLAGIKSETDLEFILGFFARFVAYREFNNLVVNHAVIYVEYEHPTITALDRSFAYGVFVLPAEDNVILPNPVVVLDLSAEVTAEVRTRVYAAWDAN